MPRQRNPENENLPTRWRLRCGTYSYMVPLGEEHHFEGKKEFTLGRSLDKARETWLSILNQKAPELATDATPADSVTVVYRCYASAGDLLYVGQSKSVSARLQTHESHTDWFSNVTRVTFIRYASRVDALRAESLAIRNENPCYNIGK